MQNDNVILNLNLNFPLIQVWAQNGNENSVILYGLLLLIFHLHTFVDASWVHLFKLMYLPNWINMFNGSGGPTIKRMFGLERAGD